jgi:hypothetical protein
MKDREWEKVGLLTKEEVDQQRRILGNFAIGGLGDKIYKLPGGELTGEGGWKMFNDALQKEAVKFLKAHKKKDKK